MKVTVLPKVAILVYFTLVYLVADTGDIYVYE